MSHIVTAKTQLTDTRILAQACRKKNLTCEVCAEGETLVRKVYNRDVRGIAAIELEGWLHPVVVQEGGKAVYDNSNGYWGDQERFEELKCDYAEESAYDLLTQQGFQLASESVVDGCRELVFAR